MTIKTTTAETEPTNQAPPVPPADATATVPMSDDSGNEGSLPLTPGVGRLDESNLEKALKAERIERKNLQKRLKALDGIDPEKYNTLVQQEAERQKQQEAEEQKRLEEKGAWEALTAKTKEENSRILAAKDEQIASLQQQVTALRDTIQERDSSLSEVKLQQQALKAFLDERGDEGDFHDFVWPKVKGNIVLTEAGEIQILDGKGALWLDENKKPLDLQGLFSNFRKGKGAKFFKPEINAEGSGMVPTGKTPNTSKVRTITRDQAASASFLRQNNISLEDIRKGLVQVDLSM